MAEAAASLRAKQKPLKEKYTSDPSSAFVTLSSTGSLDPVNLTCSLASGAAAQRVAGLHKAAGGRGVDLSGELCSGDMLLESLVACFGVTIRAVSTAMSIPVSAGSIIAEGDLDFRGTMGVKDSNPDTKVPVGFQNIRLIVRLEVDDEYKSSVEKLISLSERYCVVLQTLKAGVNVETKLGHVGKVVPDTRKENGVEVGEEGKGAGTEDKVTDEEVLPLQ